MRTTATQRWNCRSLARVPNVRYWTGGFEPRPTPLGPERPPGISGSGPSPGNVGCTLEPVVRPEPSVLSNVRSRVQSVNSPTAGKGGNRCKTVNRSGSYNDRFEHKEDNYLVLFMSNNPTFISQCVMQNNPFGENIVEVFMIQAS